MYTKKSDNRLIKLPTSLLALLFSYQDQKSHCRLRCCSHVLTQTAELPSASPLYIAVRASILEPRNTTKTLSRLSPRIVHYTETSDLETLTTIASWPSFQRSVRQIDCLYASHIGWDLSKLTNLERLTLLDTASMADTLMRECRNTQLQIFVFRMTRFSVFTVNRDASSWCNLSMIRTLELEQHQLHPEEQEVVGTHLLQLQNVRLFCDRENRGTVFERNANLDFLTNLKRLETLQVGGLSYTKPLPLLPTVTHLDLSHFVASRPLIGWNSLCTLSPPFDVDVVMDIIKDTWPATLTCLDFRRHPHMTTKGVERIVGNLGSRILAFRSSVRQIIISKLSTVLITTTTTTIPKPSLNEYIQHHFRDTIASLPYDIIFVP